MRAIIEQKSCPKSGNISFPLTSSGHPEKPGDLTILTICQALQAVVQDEKGSFHTAPDESRIPLVCRREQHMSTPGSESPS